MVGDGPGVEVVVEVVVVAGGSGRVEAVDGRLVEQAMEPELCTGPAIAGGVEHRGFECCVGASSGPVDRMLPGAATLSLLSEIADDRPLLCLLDDVHWFDQSSVERGPESLRLRAG